MRPRNFDLILLSGGVGQNLLVFTKSLMTINQAYIALHYVTTGRIFVHILNKLIIKKLAFIYI